MIPVDPPRERAERVGAARPPRRTPPPPSDLWLPLALPSFCMISSRLMSMSAMVGARWRPVTATVKGIGSARRTRLHRSLGAVDDTYVRLLSALEAAASDASRERKARIDGECVCRDQGGRAAPLANGRALAHRGERERRQSARGLTEDTPGMGEIKRLRICHIELTKQR